MGNGFTWHDVTLENGAVLDLRGAVVGGLLDQERSWPSPGKLLIDGFTYKGFGPESPSDAASRLKWLRLQPSFRPQPYQQLANVLRDNGDEAGAARVLAAKDDAQSDISSDAKFFPNGTTSLRRIAEVVLPFAIFIAALLIFSQVHYARRVAIADGESAHRHLSPQMGSETNSSDGVDGASQRVAGDAPPAAGAAGQNIFRREGEFWTIVWNGKTIRLRDAKGLRYIAHLLAHPGAEIHVHDMITVVEGGAVDTQSQAAARSDGLEIVRDVDGRDSALDFAGRSEYGARLRELRIELDEANRFNDSARSQRLRAEFELLSDELSAVLRHPASSDAERARSMVSKRIRATLDKIHDEDPALGRHFSASIKTGYFCAYLPDPDHKITWQI